MKLAIVSTDPSTFMPVCSSPIVTPKLRSISSTSSSTSIESRPSPSPKSGVASPMSSGAIGRRRLRTIACLMSLFSGSWVVVIGEGSPEAAVHADHLARDVARGVGREEGDDGRHFVRLAGAADGHAFEMLRARRFRHHLEHLGLDEAGRD